MQTMIMRLHDINLPIIRPIRSIRQPQRGPGATAEGGVDDVEDEEARVVGVSGLDADRVAAAAGVGSGCINAEDGAAGGYGGEVEGLGGFAVDVATSPGLVGKILLSGV